VAEKKYICRLRPRKFAGPPHMHWAPSSSTGFQEATVTKNLFLADVLTKTVYATLAMAAFIFVSMLLLTGLH
jgi:hypothetical protein